MDNGTTTDATLVVYAICGWAIIMNNNTTSQQTVKGHVICAA